jgi:protein gp37
MGETTGISWTEHTWNPWHGCTKISPGCKFCYMYREKERYGQDPSIVVRSKTTFNAPLKWKSGMVFTCSWSDFFIETADVWREEAWDIIRRTPHLTYQILTKRPENITARLPKDWGAGWKHVWMGVSAEDQPNFDRRVRDILQVPSWTRFLSIEPQLGPINARDAFYVGPEGGLDFSYTKRQMIHWVICGGESGPGARMFRSEWAESLLTQCREAGVAFFMKQMGSYAVLDPRYDQTLPGASRKLRAPKGDDPSEWPEYLQVQEFPRSE